MLRLLSRALGWFSLCLGLVQILAPGRLLSAIGLRPSGGRVAVTRLVGVRELTAAPGLLVSSAPVGWLAARVGGDVMDLALLAGAHVARGRGRRPVGPAMALVAAIGVVDAAATVLAWRERARRARHPDRIVKAVTVHASPADLYAFWRDLGNLPRVMAHLERVDERGEGRSHWVTSGPFGSTVEWDAEITEDRPGERIAWRSLPASGVQNRGSVAFRSAPRDLGTEVVLEMQVDVPGGPIGSAAAFLGGEDPAQQVADALRRLKQVLETGEAIVSDATVTGRKVAQRPAQPPGDEAVDRSVAVPIRADDAVGVAS